MDDKTRILLQEEIANLRIERDQLYARRQSEVIETQRDFDLYEEKRTLEHEIACLRRGDFPGPPPRDDDESDYDHDA